MKASLASILMGSFRIIPPCDRVQHKIKIFKKVHSNRGNRKLQIGTISKISWLDKISRERNRIRKIENGKIGNWRNSQIENIKTRRRIEIQEGYTPKIGTATKCVGVHFLIFVTSSRDESRDFWLSRESREESMELLRKSLRKVFKLLQLVKFKLCYKKK